MVWPSGGAFAATPVPTVPFAPARLSTIAGWPERSVSFCAIARARMSVPPPGGYGEMIRTGALGKFCAPAAIEKTAPHRASSPGRRFMRLSARIRAAGVRQLPHVNPAPLDRAAHRAFDAAAVLQRDRSLRERLVAEVRGDGSVQDDGDLVALGPDIHDVPLAAGLVHDRHRHRGEVHDGARGVSRVGTDVPDVHFVRGVGADLFRV